MDPISQGALGASMAQAGSRKQVRTATMLGCLGGLAPDVDVLIFSPTDPLLFLEFHRQFTHALAFIPIGALLCALLAWRWARRDLSFSQTWLFCALGYATHGLLDACTTYGTQLLWPFSDLRVAWNNVSIIDPLFTVPLLAFVVAGARQQRPWLGRIGLAWALSYLALGIVQRERAEAAGAALAASRGHSPERLEAKPAFATLALWKLVYEVEGVFHVDAIHVGRQPLVFPGDSITKLDVRRQLPWLDADSQQARDIERFRWFSNDYLAVAPSAPMRIVDIRYSMLPNRIDALWAIQVERNASQSAHVRYMTQREARAGTLAEYWRMLTDPVGAGAQPLPRETDSRPLARASTCDGTVPLGRRHVSRRSVRSMHRST